MSTYTYLPASNMGALKHSLSAAITTNNISTTKMAKAIGVTTQEFKQLKDNNETEITPDQYKRIVDFLPKSIILDLGTAESCYDKFMMCLYRHGLTINDFVDMSGLTKSELKKIFANKNGISIKYMPKFLTVISEKEFKSLSSYDEIKLSSDRSEQVVRSINVATLINVFMVKRGMDISTFAKKMDCNEKVIKSLLSGMVVSSYVEKARNVLRLSEDTIYNIVLNSMDENNNFGYFLQKKILNQKENIYSFADKCQMKYCDMKGIVSGTRNIKSQEFEILAEKLNLDPEELKRVAPVVKENDDKYIKYNFLKWFNENGSYKELDKVFKRCSKTIITSIRNDTPVERYGTDIIDKMMLSSGLTKSELSKPLSSKEIKEIKEFKKPRGRKKIATEVSETKKPIENKPKKKEEKVVAKTKSVPTDTNLGNAAQELFVILYMNGFSISVFESKDAALYSSLLNDNSKKIIFDELKKICTENNVQIKDINMLSVGGYADRARHMISLSDWKIVGEPKMKLDVIQNKYKEYCTNTEYKGNLDLKTSKEEIKVIENFDKSSILPKTMIEVEMIPTKKEEVKTIEDVQEKNKSSIVNKEDLFEEVDKFLELFDSLDKEHQETMLKILNLAKFGTLGDIPDFCFKSSRFAEYKKMAYILELLGIED